MLRGVVAHGSMVSVERRTWHTKWTHMYDDMYTRDKHHVSYCCLYMDMVLPKTISCRCFTARRTSAAVVGRTERLNPSLRRILLKVGRMCWFVHVQQRRRRGCEDCCSFLVPMQAHGCPCSPLTVDGTSCLSPRALRVCLLLCLLLTRLLSLLSSLSLCMDILSCSLSCFISTSKTKIMDLSLKFSGTVG